MHIRASWTKAHAVGKTFSRSSVVYVYTTPTDPFLLCRGSFNFCILPARPCKFSPVGTRDTSCHPKKDSRTWVSRFLYTLYMMPYGIWDSIVSSISSIAVDKLLRELLKSARTASKTPIELARAHREREPFCSFEIRVVGARDLIRIKSNLNVKCTFCKKELSYSMTFERIAPVHRTFSPNCETRYTSYDHKRNTLETQVQGKIWIADIWVQSTVDTPTVELDVESWYKVTE